jgi:hypothetical protein
VKAQILERTRFWRRGSGTSMQGGEKDAEIKISRRKLEYTQREVGEDGLKERDENGYESRCPVISSSSNRMCIIKMPMYSTFVQLVY